MRENPEIVWEMYQSLEKEFLNYLEYVPFSIQHYEVWSYPLVNLFNNIGSSVDSFFLNAIYCESLNDIPRIEEIRTDNHQHNMKTYRDIFETRYKLSNVQIFELRNFSSIYPFKNWSEGSSPDWWSKYTDIKHNRYQNKKRATLKVTIDALAGLFSLFITHKETLSSLIDYNFMQTQLTRESYKPILLQGSPFENLGAHRIRIKTGLFGYVFESTNFPLENSDKIKILSPNYQGHGW
jgi:hypothetical protein